MRYYHFTDIGIPNSVQDRVFDLIRDYDRMRAALDDLIISTHEQDGQPRGSDLSDPTVRAVMAREKYRDEVAAIDKARNYLPDDVRDIVFLSFKDQRRLMSFPEFEWIDAKRVTRYRKQFIKDVALFTGLLLDR